MRKNTGLCGLWRGCTVWLDQWVHGRGVMGGWPTQLGSIITIMNPLFLQHFACIFLIRFTNLTNIGSPGVQAWWVQRPHRVHFTQTFHATFSLSVRLHTDNLKVFIVWGLRIFTISFLFLFLPLAFIFPLDSLFTLLLLFSVTLPSAFVMICSICLVLRGRAHVALLLIWLTCPTLRP